ncbi:MAG: osmoprotectant transport system substrate-binding protein [Thermoleophilaceae bacterium]|nr:osmoprotectant transport system substrate-binding protein [Thermoleophilaceae bacterium]
MRRCAAALAALLIALAGCGGGSGGGSKKQTSTTAARPQITIGTKNFPEQFILGELYRQALEASGFQVRLKSDIGSSEIVDRALTAGSLDMYPEYIGVALSELAGRTQRPSSRADAYRKAKAFEQQRGFTLLAMTPFSDQNALAVLPSYAKRHSLRAIGDLAGVPGNVVIAAPPEFRTRFEGLVGLRKLYGLTRVQVKQLKIGDQYAALDKRMADAANVFTTDGQLEKGRYVLLRDPRNLFTFQNVAPVIRKDLLRKNPALATTIDLVSQKLTTKAMRAMNAAVVQRGEAPAAVAQRFLRQVGVMAGRG